VQAHRGFVEQYGEPEPLPENTARVILIAGVGTGPYKAAATLTLPTPSGILQWSVPQYVERPQPVSALEVFTRGGGVRARSELVEDVGRVAQANLSDRLAWLATKSAVRGIAKREFTQKLEEEYGLLGRVFGDVFSFASERADLRCWQTLPDSWQVARLWLPAGRHDLVLRALGGSRVPLGAFELEAGETMFIFARSLGTRLYAHPVGGLRIEPGQPAPSAAGPPSASDRPRDPEDPQAPTFLEPRHRNRP
jgi:hypothetical protein